MSHLEIRRWKGDAFSVHLNRERGFRMYLRQSTGFETHVSQPELALPHAQTHGLDGLAAAVFDLLVLASGMFAIGTEASSSPACCPGAAAAIAGARPVP